MPLVKGKLLLDLAEPYDFPPSFNSLKLKDLGSSTPLKDAVVRRIDESARGEVEVFLSEMEKLKVYKVIEDRAVDIASDSLRRLNCTLDLDKETGLAEKVYETIRKATEDAEAIRAKAEAEATERLDGLSEERDALTRQISELKATAASYRQQFEQLLAAQQEALEKATELF